MRQPSSLITPGQAPIHLHLVTITHRRTLIPSPLHDVMSLLRSGDPMRSTSLLAAVSTSPSTRRLTGKVASSGFLCRLAHQWNHRSHRPFPHPSRPQNKIDWFQSQLHFTIPSYCCPIPCLRAPDVWNDKASFHLFAFLFEC